MADLETTLMSLNPMDFFTGMEKGFKLGQQRAEEERDKALAAMETQKSAEFVAEPAIGARLATTEATRAQQELAKLLYGQETEVATRGREDIIGGRLTQLGNIRTGAEIRQAQLGGQLERVPSEEREKTALQLDRAGRLPQIRAAAQEDFDWERKKALMDRGNVEATQEITVASREAVKSMAAVRADPQYAKLHPYEQAEIAVNNTTNPLAKSAIREQQRALAVKELGNSGGNLGAIRTWLPRVHPGADVRVNARGEIEVGLPRTRRRQGPSGEAGDIIEETVLDYTAYSTDPNDRDRYIGNYVAQLAGETRPFLNAPTRAAAPTDAGAQALIDQRGGGAAPTATPAGAVRATPAAAAPAAAAATPGPVQLSGPPPAAPTGASTLPPLTEPPGAATAAAEPDIGARLARVAELQKRHAELLGPRSPNPTPETWKEVGQIETELSSLQAAITKVQQQFQQQQRQAQLRQARTGYTPPAQ